MYTKSNEISTIGVDFFNLCANVNKNLFRNHLWETGGNERYLHLIKVYFKNNAICYVVYDVCNYNSFLSIEKWIQYSKKQIIIRTLKSYKIVAFCIKMHYFI